LSHLIDILLPGAVKNTIRILLYRVRTPFIFHSLIKYR
jgi:hypothetical protein